MAIITSGASGDLLTVDPTSKAARTSLYDSSGNLIIYSKDTNPTIPTGILGMGLNDGVVLPQRIDRFGSMAIAQHQSIFNDAFEGTTLHINRWLLTSTTMAATQTTVAGLTMNSGNIVTATTGYMIQSARKFMRTSRGLLQAKFRARLERYNNSVMELGFGDAATFNGANTAGAYWQVTSAGVVQPVVTYNSVDITGSNIAGDINNTNYYTFDILIDDDQVDFVCQDTENNVIISRQTINLPLASQKIISTSEIGLQFRLYNTGVAPATAPHLILTDAYVALLDQNVNRDAPTLQALTERGCTSHPLTGAQLCQYANSAEPSSATLSNTAAGYTTLGGKFQFAAPVGAATDFCLFGFQVPTPTNLCVTGVSIYAWNVGAVVATTPTLCTFALGVGSTAVSLATATVMRFGLGAIQFPVGAVIGATGDKSIDKTFRTPLIVPAARFLQVILRVPVGTATASQVIAGMVNIEGYFD